MIEIFGFQGDRTEILTKILVLWAAGHLHGGCDGMKQVGLLL